MIALTIVGLYIVAALSTWIAARNWNSQKLDNTGTAVLVGLAVTLWTTTIAGSLLVLVSAL